MKLTHARIYGFGKWVDDTIDLSDGPAVCIYGENESGKSTLQKFILFMLFGLPPKQRAFYRPKTSGKMGGRLTVYDATVGSYTIERFDEIRNGAATCYTSDGNEFDEEWLKERLNGMTYQTYQSIFSFSAMDLTDLKGMKEDDLGEVLLGIGLTGSNNIYTIEKKLDTKIGELFKPYGKKPVINQQLESLNELFISLHHFKREEATYRDKTSEVAQMTGKIDQLQTDLQAEKSRLYAIDRQLHALPMMQDYRRYTIQLKNYPADITFPENGIERLEKVKENLLPLQSELAVLKDNEERYNEKVKYLQEMLADQTIYRACEKIIRKKQGYFENKKDLEKVQAAVVELTVQINTEINQLNIGLQQDDLDSFAFPFHIEHTWKQLKTDADQLEIENEQLQQEENQLKHQRNYLLNQMQELNDGLLSKEQFHRLNEKVNAQKEFDLLQKLKADTNKKQHMWQKNMANKEKGSQKLLTGCIILSLIAGGGAIISTTLWLFNIAVLLLFIGIGQWLWGKYTAKEMQAMFVNDSIAITHQQITEAEIEQAESLLARHQQNKLEYASLKEQEKAAEIQYIKWNEKKKMLGEKEDRLNAHIDGQLESYPFLQYVEISFWPELYHSLKHLFKLHREHQQLLQESDQIEAHLDNFKKEVSEVSQKVNRDLFGRSTEDQLRSLEEILETDENRNRQIDQYKSLHSDGLDKQRDMIQKMQIYINERSELFTIAQVDSENAYYEKANMLEEKREIIHAQKKIKKQLNATLSQAVWQQFMDSETDQHKLEVSRQQSQAAIANIEEIIETTRQELAEVNAFLSTMETSESYSKTMHQYEMEQEKLKQLAKEWAVLKTAKEMLIETKRNYRDKYLNKVMETTTIYFNKLTGNKYKKVYAPLNGRPFQVEAQDETRYAVNELSQGTVDQLYISLRMAISEIMSEKHHLPFIIDDAFVHFDINRTEQMMGIVEMIAKRQQIIVFTCKKEVVESAKNLQVILL